MKCSAIEVIMILAALFLMYRPSTIIPDSSVLIEPPEVLLGALSLLEQNLTALCVVCGAGQLHFACGHVLATDYGRLDFCDQFRHSCAIKC